MGKRVILRLALALLIAILVAVKLAVPGAGLLAGLLAGLVIFQPASANLGLFYGGLMGAILAYVSVPDIASGPVKATLLSHTLIGLFAGGAVGYMTGFVLAAQRGRNRA